MLRLQLKHVTLRTKYIRQKNYTKLDHKSKESSATYDWTTVSVLAITLL